MPPMHSACGIRYVLSPTTVTRSIEINDPYQLKEHIYSVAPEASLSIGKRSLGHISNYYPGEVITDEEVAAIQNAAEKYDVNVINTRYVVHFKTSLSSKPMQGSEKSPQLSLPFWSPPQKISHLPTLSMRLRWRGTKLSCPFDTRISQIPSKRLSTP